MRPLLSPVAMATGWVTARSTVIDSMPAMSAVARVVPAIVAISVETVTPRVAARSTMVAVAVAAAASEMPAYNKRAYIYLGTVTLAALTIRLST